MKTAKTAQTLEFRVDDGAYSLEAALTFCGRDISVAVRGGTGPHIGAAALAVPRPSLDGSGKTSASASVICVSGHKDDCLARQAALALASRYGSVALVSVGIHVDGADSAAIGRLEANFARLLRELENAGPPES